MDVRIPEPHRTRIAVFGSVAAAVEPPSVAPPGSAFDPAVGAVLAAVFEAIARRAPAIAAPVLDRALADGAITRTEHHELARELTHPRQGEAAAGRVSETARGVLREALAAIGSAAPAIARPILDEALGSERLSAAQRERIRERLAASPQRALGGIAAQAIEGVS